MRYPVTNVFIANNIVRIIPQRLCGLCSLYWVASWAAWQYTFRAISSTDVYYCRWFSLGL